MAKKVLIIAFIISTIFQGFVLWKLDMADTEIWAREAEYVQNSSPDQFNFLGAYGHPGGPIIEGTILIRNIFNVSYDKSLLIFLAIFNGLIISAACTLCFLLSRGHLWWPAVLAILSLNKLYEYSTPPSTVASLLVVLLGLFTLFLYKKIGPIKPLHLFLWSLITGLLISTRADIGIVIAISFVILLKQKISWKQMISVFLGTALFFVVFDPFMWFMPIEHIGDILYKITYHYNDFTPTKMNFLSVLSFSSLAFTGIFVSTVLIFFNKQKETLLPPLFFKIFLVTTIMLYAVFLTARSQASRYFLPMILMWEVFLPVSFFSLVEEHNVKMKNFIKIFVVILLVSYSIGMLTHSLWISRTYNLSS